MPYVTTVALTGLAVMSMGAAVAAVVLGNRLVTALAVVCAVLFGLGAVFPRQADAVLDKMVHTCACGVLTQPAGPGVVRP